MSSQDPLIEMLRTEFREIRTEFREAKIEMRDGFKLLSERIDNVSNTTQIGLTSLSTRVDLTNQRLATLEETFVRSHLELNQRIDETNYKLDLTLNKLEDFQVDVSKRFDGVGAYLRSINGTLQDHSHRIGRLEEQIKDDDE